MLVSEIILLIVLAALVYLIIPQLYQSLETIVKNSSTYINTASLWVERLLQDYPEIEQYAMETIGKVNTSLMDWLQTTVLPELGSLVANVTTGVYYVVMAIYNLIIGIIVSVTSSPTTRPSPPTPSACWHSIFSVETAHRIRRGLDFTNRTFAGFINGKLLDSAIIGLICYIVCAILNMPYALLVSVIVGVTNVIPLLRPVHRRGAERAHHPARRSVQSALCSSSSSSFSSSLTATSSGRRSSAAPSA